MADANGRALSPRQIMALRDINDGKLKLRAFTYDCAPGSAVGTVTFQILIDRELVKLHGWWGSGEADIRLTAFGRQILQWTQPQESSEADRRRLMKSGGSALSIA